MDEIRELLGRLTTLTEEELGNLRQLISAKFKELDTDEATVEDTATMVELAEATDQIMAEGSAREAKAQEAKEQREAAREKVKALSGDTEDEDDEPAEEEPEPEETEEEETLEAGTPETEETEVPEPIAATGAVARMAAAQGKPTPSPEATAPQQNRGVLTASAGYQAGRPIEDRMDLAQEMVRQLSLLSRQAPYGKVIVASSEFQYPEDRQLGMDPWENEAKIRGAKRIDPKTGALVATGGICQPVNVDYSIPTYATADTPIVDGLAGYEATRGGVRYVLPPDVAEWEPATGIWTEATDAEPGSATKPVKSLACGEEVTVYVEAVSTRIGFGNMQSRFAPEQVAANTDMALAAAARVRENNLLKLISEKCVEDVTSSKGLGATRDFLTVLHATVEMYRSVHRLPDTQALTAIFPRWIRGLIKTDIAREIGHSQNTYYDQLRIPDSYVEDMIRDAGVNPIFHLDGQPSSVAGGVAQYFTTDAASSEYKKFPTKMVWYFFAEDMIQRLDAGRLDLGVVRDSTLDATNDYETFVEVFESIAFRGFNHGALQLVTELCASGGTSGTVTAACP